MRPRRMLLLLVFVLLAGGGEVFVNSSFAWSGERGSLRRSQTGIPVVNPATANCHAQTSAKERNARRLLLISIDACRPDYLDLANLPNIRKLTEQGVTYDQAWVGHLRNDTPPGHAVMATGAFPRNNGLLGFHWRDPDTGRTFKPTSWFGVAGGQVNQVIARSGCGSIGTLYRQAFPGAKVAALSSNKFYAAAALGADSADFIGYCRYEPPKGFGTSIGQLLIPQTVTGRSLPAELLEREDLRKKVVDPWDGDTWTVDLALALLERERPEILLLNLALTDDAGHTSGGPIAREAIDPVIRNVDAQIGRLLDAYEKAGLIEETIVVVTSDHGMATNLRTIDEAPMAAIVSEYGLVRSAARLEFYMTDPARSVEAAERIARLQMTGVLAVYGKQVNPKGDVRYAPAPTSLAALDPALDATYRYLLSTYASRLSPDLVLFSSENWNIAEATSYFKGDHGTVTWDNQHIPLIVAGPGIKKGISSLAPARLVDIAPTVLTSMDLDPAKMDGVVLADALAAPSREQTSFQQARNEELAPYREALRSQHEKDVAQLASSSQQPGPPRRMATGGSPRELFRQLDRDGDGKVSRAEAGNAPWFDRLDRNRDDAIALDELPPSRVEPRAQSNPRNAPSVKPSETPVKPAPETHKPSKVSFEFTRDYTAGGKDVNGKSLSGSELMRIVSYRGELFASTSTFTDPRGYTNDPEYTGCQVLRKRSSKTGWEADATFGRRYLRTDCLQVIRFTQDAEGRPLPEPVEMLVAGIWDIGETGQPTAKAEAVAAREDVNRGVAREVFGREFGSGRRPSFVTGLNRHITIAVRDDAAAHWTISRVARVPDEERGFSSVRAIGTHRDQVTGREYLYVGAACGGLYRGVYDPNSPGRIRWLESTELDASFGRVHSMCVCNGSLYVSTDYGGLTVQKQKGGIYRRVDGPEPTWERVYQNFDPKYPTWNQTARGITAVPAEDGSGREVILTGVEWPPEPVIVRIEPHNDHRAVTELNYHDYFAVVFGRPPQILGGSKQYPHAGCECAALNYFEPFQNPATGKAERFVTLFLIHPDDPAEGSNGAYFLVRRAPGVYDWGEIPSGLPAGQHLRGTRTVDKSPFPDEPNTYYFGGCFNGPDEQPPKPNMAWIYRGRLSKTEEARP